MVGVLVRTRATRLQQGNTIATGQYDCNRAIRLQQGNCNRAIRLQQGTRLHHFNRFLTITGSAWRTGSRRNAKQLLIGDDVIYRIKEKFWSWGDNFSITDAGGQAAFYVKEKVFSGGDQLSFQDVNGNELAFISQRTVDSSSSTYNLKTFVP